MLKELGKFPVTTWQIKRGKKPKMPQVEITTYGKLWAPSTFSEFTQLISDFGRVAGPRVLWRGQSRIEWPLHSAAIRRLLKHGWGEYAGINEANAAIPYEEETLSLCLQEYETSLLNEARLRGHDYLQGRRLSDLELLGVLQHFGAATRLLDFSRNAYVALWFACNGHLEEYGVVFFARLYTVYEKARWLVGSEDTSLALRELLKKYHNDNVLVWEPIHLFQRMKVQQGIFAFGEPVAKEWGSFPVNSVGGVALNYRDSFPGLVPIAISPELKSEMVEYWGSLLGYNIATLFPEIDGFSRYHGAESDYELYFGESDLW
jgi:FRG domain